ncbi:uncharacterized protein I206_107488 [Kwoniella pini CBS 10737]|uniref:Uncharacterized protein n=1 Tax=Kwoniella pini CBS 10737 TaxID=1296096 RepID=A0AAJ8LD96_9TREE
MPYIDRRYAQQIVPYDRNHRGLYLAPGQGKNVPEKVIVCYRPNENDTDSWTSSSDYTQRRVYRNRYEYSSSDESWVLGDSYTSNSSTDSRDLPIAYQLYNLLQGMRNKLYGERYHRNSRRPRRYIDASSDDTWDATSSEWSSEGSSDYWNKTSSEDTHRPRYKTYERYHGRRRRRAHRREPGLLEKFFGW